jgi:hypothetical protein
VNTGKVINSETIMWITKRLQVYGIDWQWGNRINIGHGGDEYGNCTLYLKTRFLHIVWWYPTGHYQTEILMPEPGICAWADKINYGETYPDWRYPNA